LDPDHKTTYGVTLCVQSDTHNIHEE